MASKREMVVEIRLGRLWLTLAILAVAAGMALASAVAAAPQRVPHSAPSAGLPSIWGSYYLTSGDSYDAAEAPGACAEGYHMASLWEIWDTSNLRYETSLGYQYPSGDCGQGPPTGVEGWVRTGSTASTSTEGPGMANCSAYTSTTVISGTVVALPTNWSTPDSTMGVWEAGTAGCSSSMRVWCVRPALPPRCLLPLILRSY
jgi:hypothetical protein